MDTTLVLSQVYAFMALPMDVFAAKGQKVTSRRSLVHLYVHLLYIIDK